jgi:homoisocitrate dehydrogenase
LSVGSGVAIAEPVHGSAPDIAGQGIANPTAAILSVAMLLRHYWQRPDDAQCIEEAVRAVLSEGAHTEDIYHEGAISTAAFTEGVCQRLC